MDLNTNIAEDDNLFDMFDVIFEFWNYILSYLKDHYLVLTLTLLIFLLLISLFLYYNKIKNTKNFWSNFQIFISKHKSLSVLLFSLLLVISMIPSGIVNFISNSNNNGDPLILFIISGSVGIIILVIGLFLITPLLSFRFKYSFINEYDVENAKFINNIYRIFNNLRLSTKGIISVQLFEITELTYLDNINFNFKELFTLKEKRAKVSAFSPIKVDMPIPFFDFISKLNVEQDLDTNFLNNYQTTILSKKNKINKVFILALFDYLRELFHKHYYAKGLSYEKIEEKFEIWIKDWQVPNLKHTKYKSTHYISFFALTKPYHYFFTRVKQDNMKHIILLSRDAHESTKLDSYIYTLQYNGQNPYKKHRIYYNFIIQTNSLFEGQRRFSILLVADSRFIPNTNAASEIFKHVLQYE